MAPRSSEIEISGYLSQNDWDQAVTSAIVKWEDDLGIDTSKSCNNYVREDNQLITHSGDYNVRIPAGRYEIEFDIEVSDQTEDRVKLQNDTDLLFSGGFQQTDIPGNLEEHIQWEAEKIYRDLDF